MASKNPMRILTMNSGSSSLKFSIYEMGPSEKLVVKGSVQGIGTGAARFHADSSGGEALVDERLDLPDHQAALDRLFEWLRGQAGAKGLDAVGHRLVHGGVKYNKPHLITPELMAALRELVPLAPDHLPHELKAMAAASRFFPGLRQVACFDTAFHRQMPQLAQLYPLPRHLLQEGILRYGFHGLSYEYIMAELKARAGEEAAGGRIVIAHLGNGASMAAVRQGKSLDTTMGFTPAGGLMMSMRSGDLDPGVLIYLTEEKGLGPELNRLVNKKSGLLGLSGISWDMKELLDKEQSHPHAAQAIALFCYQAKKFLGALAAVMGGLDTLVFTGGIGENAPSIRWRICENMEFLGIRLDAGRNDSNAPVISRRDSPAAVRVMRTDEELMIARHTASVLLGEGGRDEQEQGRQDRRG